MTELPLSRGGEPLPLSGAEQHVADVRHYLGLTLLGSMALNGLLALSLTDRMSPWWLLVTVPLVYVRLALGLHELLHLRSAARVSTFHRLGMIFDTPFGLGYREHRAVHLRHHRWGAGPADPELFQIAGGNLSAFCRAMVGPEYALYHWIRQHGLGHSLVREAGFRCMVFVLVASVNPSVFLVYWLVLRLSIGASGFVFHHLLHQRAGQLGTFSLAAPPVLIGLGRLLFGTESILILTRHRAHHLWHNLRVRDLPDLPVEFDLPKGRLTHQMRARAQLAAQSRSLR